MDQHVDSRQDDDAAVKVRQDAEDKIEALKILKEKNIKRRLSSDGQDGLDLASIGDVTPTSRPVPNSEATIPIASALPASLLRSPVKSSLSGPDFDVTAPDAFQRVVITTGGTTVSKEQKDACTMLMKCLALRAKHIYRRADYYWGPLRPGQFPAAPRPEIIGGITCDVDVALIHPSPWRSCPSSLDLAGSAGVHPHGAPHAVPPLSVAAAKSPASTDVPVDSAAAASSRAPAKLESMFYRRRPVPHWRPFEVPPAPPMAIQFRAIDGVIHVFDGSSFLASPAPDSGMIAPDSPSVGSALDESQLTSDNAMFPCSTWDEWQRDYFEVSKICHTPFVKTFAYQRLEMLQSRFQLHCKLNSGKEVAESKSNPHRDLYNVRKVDTHVHHSACMNQKHLLRFIKSKLKNNPDEVLNVLLDVEYDVDVSHLTLLEVFESLGLTAYDLSTDTLDMHADMNTFQRFDRFNLKYNPVGQSRLREIFIKTDNFMKGRYLAEITQQVFTDLEVSKYTLAEYRLSIYGRSAFEWSKLAAWVVDNHLASNQVRWMIQIPRLYEVYKASGEIRCFQDMIDNIFKPLFDVSVDSSRDPKLHQFLALVVGFDSVDDESRQETRRDATLPLPSDWTLAEQPPYHYWTFFIAENLKSLNRLRASRGMSQFSYRPHAGEAGDPDHLAAAFLTAESVNHGINLQKLPPLQYLYYLAQIGLAVSPLSNNRLFLEYAKVSTKKTEDKIQWHTCPSPHSMQSPFFEFFQKGLNVSLSTDDPLMLHITKEPLVEEYCVAAQVWRLSSADLCEIARNSVLQSGFEYPWKAHFIGPNYAIAGPHGNDIHMTNVPYIRLQYRLEALAGELQLVEAGAAPPSGGASAPPSPESRPLRMKRRFHAGHTAAHSAPASTADAAGAGRGTTFVAAAASSSLAHPAAPATGLAPTVLASPRYGLGLSLTSLPRAVDAGDLPEDVPGAARGIAAAAAWLSSSRGPLASASSAYHVDSTQTAPAPLAPPQGSGAVAALSTSESI